MLFSVKVYSSNHCNTVSVASELRSIAMMTPANVMDCGIICADSHLIIQSSHYPSVGQRDQRHWANLEMGEKIKVSAGP